MSCSCPECARERQRVPRIGPSDRPCLFDELAKRAIESGRPVPTVMLLHCTCSRCYPISSNT